EQRRADDVDLGRGGLAVDVGQRLDDLLDVAGGHGVLLEDGRIRVGNVDLGEQALGLGDLVGRAVDVHGIAGFVEGHGMGPDANGRPRTAAATTAAGRRAAAFRGGAAAGGTAATAAATLTEWALAAAGGHFQHAGRISQEVFQDLRRCRSADVL